MAADALITLRQLTGGYGGTPVLQGVDLSVEQGEIVAVIGRNGVGKTTLMRALIGLVKTTSGSIQFDGSDITQVSVDLRARLGIAYIPQGRDVFPQLTVAENLVMGEIALKPGAKASYERIHTYFPVLKERAGQRAGTLSGGQQQQLAIARAMLSEPRVMLLDEPSEGIQPSIIKDIARHVRRLNADTGMTVVLVEQNLELIVSLAERGFVLEKGRVTRTLEGHEIQSADTVRRHLAL